MTDIWLYVGLLPLLLILSPIIAGVILVTGGAVLFVFGVTTGGPIGAAAMIVGTIWMLIVAMIAVPNP